MANAGKFQSGNLLLVIKTSLKHSQVGDWLEDICEHTRTFESCTVHTIHSTANSRICYWRRVLRWVISKQGRSDWHSMRNWVYNLTSGSCIELWGSKLYLSVAELRSWRQWRNRGLVDSARFEGSKSFCRCQFIRFILMLPHLCGGISKNVKESLLRRRMEWQSYGAALVSCGRAKSSKHDTRACRLLCRHDLELSKSSLETPAAWNLLRHSEPWVAAPSQSSVPAIARFWSIILVKRPIPKFSSSLAWSTHLSTCAESRPMVPPVWSLCFPCVSSPLTRSDHVRNALQVFSVFTIFHWVDLQIIRQNTTRPLQSQSVTI